MLLHYKQLSKETVLSRGVMVDVEAGGKSPARYPLLSIGATVIGDVSRRFYVELKPDIWNFDPAALAVCKLDPDTLWREGMWPQDALSQFVQFVHTHVPQKPLFVANNAPFDWMYWMCYCDKYNVVHPFGHWPFDTKSAYGDIMTTPIPHHAGEDTYLHALDLRRYYASAA